MNHNPMGGFGVDTDIITGRPRVQKTMEQQQVDASLREHKVVEEAFALTQELPAALPIIARQLEKRILELVRQDPHCISILQIIGAFRQTIEVAPQIAAKVRRQAMGPILNSLTDETAVAPEGIPTEE